MLNNDKKEEKKFTEENEDDILVTSEKSSIRQRIPRRMSISSQMSVNEVKLRH